MGGGGDVAVGLLACTRLINGSDWASTGLSKRTLLPYSNKAQ